MDCALTQAESLIRQRLAQKIGPQRYNIWFRNSTQFSVADGFLKVGVPNLFIGTWIENHFSETIAEAAREVTGHDLQVALAIDPELHASLRKEQMDRQAEVVVKIAEGAAEQNGRRGYVARPRALRGRLDDFVVGPCNRMAYTSALTVADGSAPQFGLLFIYGGCGLGKTHLLQGICNALADRGTDRRWLYVSGEEFTNQFLRALKDGKLEEFRGRFRSLDVLVVDDIHFLANKRATQEEFLHTYNTIEAASKQVVLASDTHPKLMGRVPETLVSRFVCGMVLRIDPPDRETRCEILRRRASKLKRDIPEDVIGYIAANLRANVRELEGALLKLLAYASVVHEAITVEMARQALADHLPRADRIVTVNDIESRVATFFGLSPVQLHSSRKTRAVALARAISMYLARKYTSMSFPEIGRLMGNKNHSTVIVACRKIERGLGQDATMSWEGAGGVREMKLAAIVDGIEEELGRS